MLEPTSHLITITLCYAASVNRVAMQLLSVQNGSSLASLLAMPEVHAFVSDNAIADSALVGVFSHTIKAPASYQLQDGDRVEWYRCLSIDPMRLRKQKVILTKKHRNNAEP